MNALTLKPIGMIHTPFENPEGTPIQPRRANGARGTVELYPEFAAGLADLDGFSHVVLLYYFHRSEGYKLSVIPYLDTEPRGLFATRAPRRPNPIGLSVVQLELVHDGTLDVVGVDMLDGTPLLDIKPHVPEFDSAPETRLGWLSKVAKDGERKSADNRFHES
jgi:tRNA-Thr(GGU) m(6)t(6)A37 methyltransferase TsaA